MIPNVAVEVRVRLIPIIGVHVRRRAAVGVEDDLLLLLLLHRHPSRRLLQHRDRVAAVAVLLRQVKRIAWIVRMGLLLFLGHLRRKRRRRRVVLVGFLGGG